MITQLLLRLIQQVRRRHYAVVEAFTLGYLIGRRDRNDRRDSDP